MQNNFRKFKEPVFLDFWIPDSRFWFPVSVFWIPDSGFHFPNSEFRIPDSGFHFPDFGFRIPDSGFRIPLSKFRIPDSSFWFPPVLFTWEFPSWEVIVTNILSLLRWLNQNRIICNLSLVISKPPEHVSSSSGRGGQGGKSPFSLLSEPISPSSLSGYVSFSPSSLLFPLISPSSQLCLGHFSLPTLFGPFLPPPYSVPPPSFQGTVLYLLFLLKAQCLLIVKFSFKRPLMQGNSSPAAPPSAFCLYFLYPCPFSFRLFLS